MFLRRIFASGALGQMLNALVWYALRPCRSIRLGRLPTPLPVLQEPIPTGAKWVEALMPGPLLDHLVGACQQRGRKFDPERLRRFEVEGQHDSCSLLDRQIGRFLALENTSGIDASLVEHIAEAAAIAHQATG